MNRPTRPGKVIERPVEGIQVLRVMLLCLDQVWRDEGVDTDGSARCRAIVVLVGDVLEAMDTRTFNKWQAMCHKHLEAGTQP